MSKLTAEFCTSFTGELLSIDVHEAMTTGDRIAARYTLHVRYCDKDLTIEV